MPSFNKAVLAAFGFGALAGLAAGCQVYDFEPVVPLTYSQLTEQDVRFGRAVKPNLMLLVDKSGSMDLPADRTDPDCILPDAGICGVNKSPLCDSSVCPTRWTELQGAMDDFLGTQGEVARMGLAVYPTNLRCGESVDGGYFETTAVPVHVNSSNDDPGSLIATASEINAELQAISSLGPTGSPTTTGGGTPTGASLRTLGQLPELNDDDREDLILLLTDGLPNCNPSNPYVGTQPECRCTLTNGCSGSFLRLGCLDEQGTVGVISENHSRQIRTIVVGFGDETAGGADVLNAMALAGGFVRGCDPANNTCPAGESCVVAPDGDFVCSDTKYYQAANRSQLAQALAEIGGLIDTNPCEYKISQDPQDFDPRLIVVYLTEFGQATQRLTVGPDTFAYTPPAGDELGKVTLLGQTCQIVSNATSLEPVEIRVSVLRSL